ncbi:MAG: DUF2270 domain-containing protein [Acidobacteria bacterium]|nr:MAG: DUF2270 domain-containing protein [Acidobacteriota bacterium]REK01840.1 MAG: DUF2270 domain-containing protein [Acidobacteriota bacterium]REK14796.1 MAG: DUF2270 domain-containing protein [Acidobacteriota bacterium]REK45511.1 MAG: DUF2270 domain-containing protein [Acidobacteriota bacterium]
MSDPIQENEDTFGKGLRLHSDNPDLVALTEEVRERKQKPKTDPTAIPQKLELGEFNTAMCHFYRGEVSRSNTWRTRLDATTNWAVITAGATLSFVFSSADNPHFAIPINSILVAIFLLMEARRYRYYEVWANRVRVLETGYFAPMLSYRAIPPDKEWAEHVSGDLIDPHFTISEWEAIGRRLRSNYIWIFVLLALSWTLKVYLHPFPTPSFEVFLERAAVGLAPGWLVISVGVVFNAIVFAFAVGTLKLNQASSEVQPHEEYEWRPIQQVSKWADSKTRKRKTIRRARRARQRTSSAIHRTNA